ncbi:anti-sigma factor domain-containing protein [Rossellomorea aquimaris]|uniref:anti-sigma factor domain-containing protein n=1 Tax=Rossellomorea aquimaris TaxID=189382 RepID=UPI001CD36088|nr:anti-sigma factor domain-containing protein [Rossellomorea aquimaris]MCA1059412.1 anti-sigma factor domain-containing protein [Rossellomorea aquimaris]
MKQGIIMEIKRDILIMMTPEGEFLKGRKQPDQQYSIGEEIPFFPLHKESSDSKPVLKWNWKISTSLLTVLVLIIAVLSSAMIQNNRAYAYVSVDINPSMELTLNKGQEVIEIKPFNDDAKVLIKELPHWENEDVGKVTKEILLLSERLGYLKNKQDVLITSSFLDDTDRNKENELLDELNEFVEGYSSDHHTNIIVKETSKAFREEAAEKGMTAGSLIRESEKNTYRTIEPVKNENSGIKKEIEKQESNTEDKNSHEENQKVTPSVNDKNQSTGKPEGLHNDAHTKRENPQPGKNDEKEKPDKQEYRDHSQSHKENRGHHQSNHDDKDYSHSKENQDHSKHDENENRKEEKKEDHEERKNNRKD